MFRESYGNYEAECDAYAAGVLSPIDEDRDYEFNSSYDYRLGMYSPAECYPAYEPDEEYGPWPGADVALMVTLNRASDPVNLNDVPF